MGNSTDIFEVITERRSIRKFKEKPVDKESIIELLKFSIQAPSGKNKQPWRFVVLEGQPKKQLEEIFENSVQSLKKQGVDTGSSEWTIKTVKEAPVLVLVYNSCSRPDDDHNGIKRYPWLVDIQSIGGAIQTMLLAAAGMGLGTLWICDIFYAECEIANWLNRDDELVAALAIGYPDEKPNPRPRLDWQEVTKWLD